MEMLPLNRPVRASVRRAISRAADWFPWSRQSRNVDHPLFCLAFIFLPFLKEDVGRCQVNGGRWLHRPVPSDSVSAPNISKWGTMKSRWDLDTNADEWRAALAKQSVAILARVSISSLLLVRWLVFELQSESNAPSIVLINCRTGILHLFNARPLRAVAAPSYPPSASSSSLITSREKVGWGLFFFGQNQNNSNAVSALCLICTITKPPQSLEFHLIYRWNGDGSCFKSEIEASTTSKL